MSMYLLRFGLVLVVGSKLECIWLARDIIHTKSNCAHDMHNINRYWHLHLQPAYTSSYVPQ